MHDHETGTRRPVVSVVRLPHAKDIPLPSYQSGGAAGMDLIAALAEGKTVVLAPGERALIPTGLSMAIPYGFEGQVRARSGLAIRNGITLPNAPGTIDSDYRGEICVPLMNLGQEPFTVTRGMRIAQLLITPVVQAVLQEVDQLDTTERGYAGFGSTGV